VAIQEKIAAIRNWWAENHPNFSQRHPLYEKIDAAVKALPEYPEERAPENSWHGSVKIKTTESNQRPRTKFTTKKGEERGIRLAGAFPLESWFY
jgi:hypothetical protein